MRRTSWRDRLTRACDNRKGATESQGSHAARWWCSTSSSRQPSPADYDCHSRCCSGTRRLPLPTPFRVDDRRKACRDGGGAGGRCLSGSEALAKHVDLTRACTACSRLDVLDRCEMLLEEV